MKLTINKRTLAAVVSTLFVATDAVVVETDNIVGLHTVNAGQHYADCTNWLSCLGGNNWGNNGEQSWHVKVTFSDEAASYSGGSCFADTVEYYDWNKLWGKARCGYSHNHQQDSDRFVWRRLQNLHTPANCGGLANCTGIQLGTYSYDGGTVPYPNEDWPLSKVFSTILQPNIAYILKMESFADGRVDHSIYTADWTLLETKTNQHSNLCPNYLEGSVLGLYFGGTCEAPENISVLYETAEVPPEPTTSSPSKSPTTAPTKAPSPPTDQPSKSPTKTPVTNSPTSGPTSSPSKSPTAITYVDKYICAKNDPGDTEVCSTGNNVGGECTTNGSACACGRNGRCKTCFVASCAASSPSPTQAPTPSGGEPPNASCPVCGNGTECCPADGKCATSGKPSNRQCIPNRLRRA